MRDPEQSEVFEAINQGILKAQEDYAKAYESHINNSEYCPEYLMTVYIFQSLLMLLKNCDRPYGLSLEEPVYRLVSDCRKMSGRHSRGVYRYGLRKDGKCDLSLKDKNDKPLAAIEVKENPWTYYSDIDRLAGLVTIGLPFGVFASCWFEEVSNNDLEEAENRLTEEMQSIYEHISQDINRMGDNLSVDKAQGNVKCLVLEGEESKQKQKWKWCPVCFMIHEKGTSNS